MSGERALTEAAQGREMGTTLRDVKHARKILGRHGQILGFGQLGFKIQDLGPRVPIRNVPTSTDSLGTVHHPGLHYFFVMEYSTLHVFPIGLLPLIFNYFTFAVFIIPSQILTSCMF